MRNTISLEHHNNGFRAIIFVETDQGTYVDSICETSELCSLLEHVAFTFPSLFGVRRSNSEIVVPDCLSVLEAAEACMVDLRDAVAA